MPDNHYMHPRLARLYNISDEPQVGEEEFFLSLAEKTPSRVLDLGCGVGKLCEAFAAGGHKVTGVDPAPAMLDVAADKPHGDTIQWIEVRVQDLDLGTQFELITMTGHAFQVLLQDDDISRAFNAVQCHLAPGGKVAFESRNPDINWAERWAARPESSWTLDGDTVQVSTNVLDVYGAFLTFEHIYQFPDEPLRSESTLRFPSRTEIEAFLGQAGLSVQCIYGNWDSNPFDQSTSPEMIFVAERSA